MVTVVETGYVRVYRNPDKNGGSNFFAWYLKKVEQLKVQRACYGGKSRRFGEYFLHVECTFESLHRKCM